MGEPITLYDAEGQPVTAYGQAYVAEMVAAGVWFWQPPEPAPAARGVDAEPGQTAPADAPAAASRKPRKGKEL